MLSKRKQTRLNWRYISILAYYNEANRISYKGIKIAHSEIAFLSACLLENKRTNDLVPLKRIKSIIGVKLSVDRLVDRLINLGLLLRPGYGLYLVSSEGEYFLRDLESMFTRIAENRDLSRWRKIVSEDDPRLKYVRPARVKGSFVLANPKDVRMIAKRVKAGLVAVWTKPGDPVKVTDPLPDSDSIV